MAGSSVCHTPWIIPLILLLISAAAGQQDYNEPDSLGYKCASATSSCQTFAAFRALQGDTLRSVGTRFGISAEQVSQASQIPDSAPLTAGQLLLIPLNCSCLSGRSLYNVSYIIQKGDTFYDVSQKTFQGLTTFQAVEQSNPSAAPTQLEPGDSIIFPIRCACPSSQQTTAGVRYLVTYPLVAGDSVESLAAGWSISGQTIRSGNLVSGSPISDANFQAVTTLLLPVTAATPVLPQQSVNNTPAVPAVPPVSPSSGGSSDTGKYVGVGVGAAGGVLLAALAVFFCVYSRRRRAAASSKQQQQQSLASISTERYGSLHSSEYGNMQQQQKNQNELLLVGMNDLVDSEKPVVFTYEELKQATNGFSKPHLIQGSVYRGVVRNQMVAIKEMKGGASSQELKILCKVHHTNLVRLVGVCSAGDQLFLVYDYAENGSLSSCLHNRQQQQPVELSDASSAASSASSLTWNSRLQVAQDVATGLEYIHDYTKPSFVHKDVKSSNILLDASLRAKIANFGMARLADDAVLTKHIAGTQGYMSPEYLNHGLVSTKLDVYSFGVVMFELLTGKEAIFSEGFGGKEYLADVMIQTVDEMKAADREMKIQKLRGWLDPMMIESSVSWDSVLSFVELARACIDADPDSRPNMKDATYKLSKLLQSELEREANSPLNRRYNSAQMEGR